MLAARKSKSKRPPATRNGKLATMTRKQMFARYPSEWILVEDPVVDGDLNLVRGRVACHSKDRDEVYSHLVARQPARAATLYTGTLPDDSAVVL